jgi:hypothetical protein
MSIRGSPSTSLPAVDEGDRRKRMKKMKKRTGMKKTKKRKRMKKIKRRKRMKKRSNTKSECRAVIHTCDIHTTAGTAREGASAHSRYLHQRLMSSCYTAPTRFLPFV